MKTTIKQGFPWASAWALLYPVAACILYIRNGAPVMAGISYGIANLGYLLAAAGIVAGSFRVLGLKSRPATLIAAVVAFLIGTVGSNLALHAEPAQRQPRPTLIDNPATTNDESNDQPLGTAGTMTLCVTNHGSGNSYPLDADVSGTTVATIYFAKGGNVDFPRCRLDTDYRGTCQDQSGRGWTFSGKY